MSDPRPDLEVVQFQASDFVLLVLLALALFYALPRAIQRWLADKERSD
jgi:hypothetical protein